MTFEEILKETEACLTAHSQAQEAVSAWTSRGRLRQFFMCHIIGEDHTEEDAFLSLLREEGDTKVEKLVCALQGHSGWPELTSYHLRQGLVELNPANADTLLFVMSDKGLATKRLGATLYHPL